MRRTLGKPIELASELDRYRAMAHVVRDRIMDDWIETVEHYKQQDVRVVAYLSAEFLLGPAPDERHAEPWHYRGRARRC